MSRCPTNWYVLGSWRGTSSLASYRLDTENACCPELCSSSLMFGLVTEHNWTASVLCVESVGRKAACATSAAKHISVRRTSRHNGVQSHHENLVGRTDTSTDWFSLFLTASVQIKEHAGWLKVRSHRTLRRGTTSHRIQCERLYRVTLRAFLRLGTLLTLHWSASNNVSITACVARVHGLHTVLLTVDVVMSSDNSTTCF